MSCCTDCGAELDKRGRSVTGRCRFCSSQIANRCPERRKRVSEGMKRWLALNPAEKDAHRKRLLASRSSEMATDGRRRAAIDNKIWLKGNESQPAGSPSRVRAGAKSRATKLSWCPPDLRDEYLFLIKVKRIKAAEARPMIEQQHELEMARWRRSVGAAAVNDELEKLATALRVRNMTPVDRVMSAAAAIFDVTVADIRSPDRARHISIARYAVASALQRGGMSTPKIAAALGRNDHTAAIHLLRRAQWFAAHDMTFAYKAAHVSAAWDGVQQVAA